MNIKQKIYNIISFFIDTLIVKRSTILQNLVFVVNSQAQQVKHLTAVMQQVAILVGEHEKDITRLIQELEAIKTKLGIKIVSTNDFNKDEDKFIN